MPGTARPELVAKRASASAYSRWAPIYDLIFDLPFESRWQAAGLLLGVELTRISPISGNA